MSRYCRTDGRLVAGGSVCPYIPPSLLALEGSAAPPLLSFRLTHADGVDGIVMMQLSDNPGLNGHGLSVLGDCCPKMTELSLSKCPNIAEWALTKVLHGCRLLEVIDLSHCPQVKDEVVKALAEQ